MFELVGHPAMQSPNLLPNPRFEGAVAAGSLPTVWSLSPGALSSSVVQAGGATEFQFRINGTSGVSDGLNFFQDSNSTIVEPTWIIRYSGYLRLVSGSITNLTSLTLGLICFDRSGGFTNFYGSSDFKGSIGATATRFSFDATLAGGDRRISANLGAGYSNSAAVDITLGLSHFNVARVA